MNNRKTSVDGFIPRKPGSEIGENHGSPHGSKRLVRGESVASRRRQLMNEDDLQQAPIGVARAGKSIGRSDIDASLRELDEPEQQGGGFGKMSRRDRRRYKKEHRTKAQKVRKRIIIAVILLIVAGLLAVGGYLAYKTFSATGKILRGSVADLIQSAPLKKDANGRSNFLILGTSEDDPGHQGGDLTDSMMVLSIDQDKKNAYTFSIPRDLYVQFGINCLTGSTGKINQYFSCVNTGTDDAAEQDRLAKTQALVGDIVGLDIQYGVHVNYTVMRDVVNAIGGSITVNIQGSGGAPGVMDSNFDWKCGDTYAKKLRNCPPNGHFIEYPNGETVLDAEHALYLAQARGDIAPTYGLGRSNFDREQNQQKILVAIKDKAMSAGTFTNLGAVTGLLDALGNNLRTNVQTKEVRTLMQLGHDVKNENIKAIDFNADGNQFFTSKAFSNAGSSVIPAAGTFTYGPLRVFIKKQLSAEAFVKEDPHVVVLNGSNTAGVAQTLATKLEGMGFTVDKVANAPDGTYDAVEIYQIDSTKTATAAKLKSLYKVELKTTAPPVSVTGDTDFVIIVGSATVVQ